MTKAAVIGLGTMGAGIAAVMARAGVEVRAYDISTAAMDAARKNLSTIAPALDRLSRPIAADARPVRFHETLEAAVEGADLVLENVPERLELKQEVFRSIEPLVGSNCILASDTSGIPITRLQEALAEPGRMIGMHWSNPPHIIPIVEVIAGEESSGETTQWMLDFVRSIAMTPVHVKKDVPGFVENRVLYAIMREAIDLVEQGVIEPEALDTCVSWGIGYKLSVVGPMALLDMAGLDIYRSVSAYLNADLCNRADTSAMIEGLTEAGKLGIKSGEGLFRYPDDTAEALRAKRVRALIAVQKALEDNL